ncbi:50S ribosomal protein L18 [Alkaliphilus oremlandii]|uniref:Large ribosomal subunit protein uL18 n=1 Tax=Alkaliphilus oremlandii (strain OhILAs) TaxID=350688 RepID=RL18_ALKOO|nr:50S ribosomal protein L18 [Alkaliphilus oremlandii]A8MLF6.1 RecName: Full=Large ribosomal subunit protein uL18; AltName: Full=50S ribosomal protein L18 [Alkaliphilus oremlandii OhILAs]ABW18070.1 ribosomal protein L18 [Alkaliphilus oremlandii OhILAs]
MFKKVSKNANRLSRHQRVRNKITGTPERPRLNVYRSLTNIYVQLIDDVAGKTLVAASSLDKEIKDQVSATGNAEAAKLVGQLVGKRALEKGIDTVTFDRGGNIYHGRIQALAEGAREAGLKF